MNYLEQDNSLKYYKEISRAVKIITEYFDVCLAK